EADLVAGRAHGPLHGVPLGLKDLFNTAGVRTTAGSKILADSVPAEDATVVRRLRAAGAIVLGKLNLHEFAYGPEGLDAPYGPADPRTSVLPVPDYGAALTGDIKGLRVGLLKPFFMDGSAPDVVAAVEGAARALQGLGAIVDEVRLESMGHVAAASFAIVAS